MLDVPSTTEPRATEQSRRKFLDNPRVLAIAFLVLTVFIGGLFWLSRRSAQADAEVLTDVLLYPLLALSVALLLTLGLVLARNLLKLWVEHRQAAPFAKYR